MDQDLQTPPPIVTKRRSASPKPTSEIGVQGVPGAKVVSIVAARRRKFMLKPVEGGELTRVSWLWKPFFQRSALNLITGDPGVGKSTLVCELAAALSSGRALPGQDPKDILPPQRVWICNAEDNAEDTIFWRLQNQGANKANVFVTDKLVTLDKSAVTEVREIIKEHRFDIIFFDPLQAWMGGQVDMNRANETREWAGGLRDIAMEVGCAIVFVRHRRKGAAGDNALHAGLGSIDISGFARSEVSVTKPPSGLCYLSRTKGNIGPTNKAVAYELVPHKDPLNDHAVLTWRGEVDPDAPAAKISRVPRNVAKCRDWLKGFLLDGPQPATDIFKEAGKKGYGENTVRKAKIGVAIPFQSRGDGGMLWLWRLDERPAEQDEAEVDGTRDERTYAEAGE